MSSAMCTLQNPFLCVNLSEVSTEALGESLVINQRTLHSESADCELLAKGRDGAKLVHVSATVRYRLSSISYNI